MIFLKNALVTGANGFIGSWLCKELSEKGVSVTAIVRNQDSDVSEISKLKNLKVIYCELKDIMSLPEKVEDEKFDVFFHLAWDGAGGKGRADYSLQLNNVQYSLDCAVVAKQLGCNKFLTSGTITEKIAENILGIDFKADNVMYGIAKHTTHCMLDVLCAKIELDYVWMRFSNIYGPRSINGNIVGYTIAEFIRGNIPSFSKAEQPYDLLYVEDLVKAIYLIGKSEHTKNCYYIGSGKSAILKDYLIDIKRIYGKGCNLKLGARPDDGLKYYEEWFNTDDLVNDVGFKCTYSFEEGILKTIKWIEENINHVF